MQQSICELCEPLQTLKKYLITEILPQQERLEYEPTALKEALQWMAQHNMLAAYIPQKYGGLGLTFHEHHLFKKMLAQHSTALAFLQTQHQSSARMILHSKNNYYIKNYLPQMASGSMLIGMALSQLAHYHVPKITAKHTKEGYLIDQLVIRYATGFGFFEKLLIGFFTKIDNVVHEVFAMIPFTNQDSHQGSISLSEHMDLLCAKSTNTVSLEIKNWFIPNVDVLMTHKISYFYNKSLTSTNQDSFMSGVIAATFELISDKYSKYDKSLASKIETILKTKINSYEDMIVSRKSSTLVSPIRAFGIRLCDDLLKVIRQMFKGELLITNSPISKKYQWLCHSRDLYSVVIAYDDLLLATLNHMIGP